MSRHTGLRSAGLVTLFLLIVALGRATHAAEPDAIRDALLAGNVATISQAMAEHQRAWDRGEIDRDDYIAPYHAFSTSHPAAAETIGAWLATEPESPLAAAAQGIRLTHRARLVLGPYLPGRAPAAAGAEIQSVAAEAQPLLARVLEAHPNHLPAAHALDLLGAMAERPDWREQAMAVLSADDTPLAALLAELRFRQITGGEAGTFCADHTGTVEGISHAQCLAIVKPPASRTDERLGWRTIGTLPQPAELELAALDLPRLITRDPGAAFGLAVQTGLVQADQAMTLAYRLGPQVVMKDLIAPRHEDDPLDPEWLTALSTMQFQMGRPSLAWQSIESALTLGAHHPQVRLARLKAMGANQDMRWQMADELLDAMRATDGSPDLVFQYLNRLLRPPPTLSNDPDGAPNARFACVRLVMMERFTDLCAGAPSGGRCSQTKTGKAAALIGEITASGNCPQAGNWRDRMDALAGATK